MICFSCGHCSQHVLCPYCGEGTTAGGQVKTVVGFSISDLPNPFSYAYDLGRSITRPSAPSSTEGLPNPFATAYETGYGVGTKVAPILRAPFEAITAPFDALSSFMSVLKWVIVGGAVVGALVLIYGVLKFVPVALSTAAANVGEVNKMIPAIAAKALR